jgi:hypothetical protein
MMRREECFNFDRLDRFLWPDKIGETAAQIRLFLFASNVLVCYILGRNIGWIQTMPYKERQSPTELLSWETIGHNGTDKQTSQQR